MNLLNQPIMVLAVVGVAAVIWFGYFWLHPRLKDHNLLRLYFDMMFAVVMLTLVLNFLVFAPWKWPTNIESLMYDIFMIRVNGMPTNAHVWSYMTIPVLFAYAWHVWSDEWRAFLASAFMVFLHEGIWFIFYYAKYLPTIDWSSELWADATFLLLIATFGVIFWKKYSLRGLEVVVLPQVVYDIEWFIIGFPITTTNNRAQMVTYGLTKWADVLWVNQIEVFGWLLMLTTMIVWVHLSAKAPCVSLNSAEGQDSRQGSVRS